MNSRKRLRLLSFFVFLLLIVNVFSNLTGVERVSAAPVKSNTTKKRAIGIVFDDSGSMYKDFSEDHSNPDAVYAWCRATYAMESFATMMNENDVMYVHPMNSISVDGNTYTRDNPLKITQATANKIRSIISTPGDTHIEAIGAACANLEKVQADEKWLVVLTDGDEFYKTYTDPNGEKKWASLGDQTVPELEKELTACVQKVNVMYLGIGSNAAMPEKVKGAYKYIPEQTTNSSEVLDKLSSMCNTIFGRDVLSNAGETLSFDVSLRKLIVFVQGTGINNVKLGNKKPVSAHEMKYSTNGTNKDGYDEKADTSLQGKMLIYKDLAAGEYALSYEGDAKISCYYELDADLVFVFTDSDGNDVDPQALYEGDYKMSFGMKDAKTGKLITSKLLGDPKKPTYKGTYTINGVTCEFEHENVYQGEESISLKMNETFYAELTVEYLSGFSITKDSSSFGWPEGGIRVAAKPAGDLKLEISGGEKKYLLQSLPEGAPFIVKVFHQGKQLTGDALKSVALKWDETTSTAKLEPEFANDHYKIKLNYKDPQTPQETLCGPCTVKLKAFYTAPGCSESQVQADLKYRIDEDVSKIKVNLRAPDDYIVIKDLADSKAIVAKLTVNGRALTPEEFKRVDFKVDCGGIAHTVTPNPEESSYYIQLQETPGIKADDYRVRVDVSYTDSIGRTVQANDKVGITLSHIPLWVKWLIGLLLLLLLIILILIILHIKVLPKHAHITKRDSKMIFDGEDETKSTTFIAKIEKGQMTLHSKYGGTKTGIAMDVKPGPDSYLKTPPMRRSAEVKSGSVKKYGMAKIQEASIGSIRYVLNEETGKLERVPKKDTPFVLKHGMRVSYSGTMMRAGTPKPFTVTTKLNFKKK